MATLQAHILFLKATGFALKMPINHNLLLLTEMICAQWSVNQLQIHCNLGSRII